MKKVCGAALLILLMALPAGARVTMSGVLEAYNPGKRRLLLRLDSGNRKRVVLTPDARFEIYGNRVSPANFRQGMRVAVRLAGALNDEPLHADLLTDAGSSSRYVQIRASSPYYTPVGSYATTGGSGGILQGSPSFQAPSVIGPLGLGGLQPSSVLHPGQPLPGDPGMPARPAPAGSPFLGDALGQGPGPGGLIDSSGSRPAENPAGGLMGAGDGDGQEEGSGAFGFGPSGPRVVQMQARVLQVDPARRLVAVQVPGSPQPRWVLVPPAIYVVRGGTRQGMALEQLQAGQTVQVTGMTNAAGIVEARQVIAAP